MLNIMEKQVQVLQPKILKSFLILVVAIYGFLLALAQHYLASYIAHLILLNHQHINLMEQFLMLLMAQAEFQGFLFKMMSLQVVQLLKIVLLQSLQQKMEHLLCQRNLMAFQEWAGQIFQQETKLRYLCQCFNKVQLNKKVMHSIYQKLQAQLVVK